MDPVLRHDLTRLPTGEVMCCICFTFRRREDLFVDQDGAKWDLCGDGTCAKEAGLG